ncbi:MAG TPA: histidine kinase, partial [Flavobacterium sp.]|nr:histidine kinase [Flavobacterium sp.]
MESNDFQNYFYFLVAALVLVVGIALILGYKLFKSLKRKEAIESQFQQLEDKVSNLQLETLEAKLNPHLFKNILNSIQSHAYQTYFALDKLANVLDYILYESRKKFVTPKDE